ncbi:hypothetical protein HYV87_05610 [Candidatus Woesearchaeota archaeon]|nr:hypothetical protein [Candidatus Woesearchaeota archaeon]MBI2582572.1 hypothetical protein [Candidatus Woesearchaeota archaeon]
MPPFWEKIEHYNSRLIPFALVLLLGIIIFELFIHVENHSIELAVKIADALVITIFVIDLIFLAHKARSAKFFFKKYWLDILAVFPFVLFFRVIESAYRVALATERLTLGQAILHETVEASKSTKVLAKSGKIVRIGARILRIITKSRLFMKVHHGRKKQKQTKNKR